MASLPNLITLARFICVPVVVYLLLQDSYKAAFFIFVAAGISDALDGLIAKQFGLTSVLGAYLDPLADKALLVGAYIALASLDHVALWLVFLIVFRDIIIVGGALLYQTITQSLRMEPLIISKINTAAQIALAGVVLADLAFTFALGDLTMLLTYLVAATTFLSGAAYVITWGRRTIGLGGIDRDDA